MQMLGVDGLTALYYFCTMSRQTGIGLHSVQIKKTGETAMLNVGIIGLGGWGRRLVEAVQGKSDSIRFTAAVTGTPAKREAFASQHGFKVSGDLKAMLADASIDAVVSSGPAGLHAAHSLAALEAGKPVLAVKPMALKRADAEALRAAAKKHGVLLALGYNRCFFPAIAELRRRVAAGDLGTLLHMEGNFCVDRYFKLKPGTDWKTDTSQVLAGALADHPLYTMIELMGPVAEVVVARLDPCNQTADHRHHGDAASLCERRERSPDRHRRDRDL